MWTSPSSSRGSHEGAEIDDLDDLAVVDRAELSSRQCRDQSIAALRTASTRDLDRAVVVDVDLGRWLVISRITLPPEPMTRDLVLGIETSLMRAHLADFVAARSSLGHLAEDVSAPLRLGQRDAHDLLVIE